MQSFADTGVAKSTHHFFAVRRISPDAKLQCGPAHHLAALVSKHLEECMIHIEIASFGERADRDGERTRPECLCKKSLPIPPMSTQQHIDNRDSTEIKYIGGQYAD